MSPPIHFFVPLLALVSSPVATRQVLLGPAFATPSNLAAVELIQSTAASLVQSFEEALTQGTSSFGNFSGNATSLSLTAASTDDAGPFFDFHFSSPQLNTSAGSLSEVTADSIYRIGSISKLFTVYGLLLDYGIENWDRPVTDFIPELRVAESSSNATAVNQVQWDKVTIDSLASQLSGIGRDYNNADLASQPFPWDEAGLPILPPEDIPTCAGKESLPPCDRDEYYRGLIKRHPVFAPYTTPTYSNAGFRILGNVLEAVTKKSFATAMSQSVFQPLGLNHTSATTPQDKGVGVIPAGDSGWSQALGDEVPTGGIFSSSRDLVEFGRAILGNKQLSSLETRRWMKPHSHTSSLSASVGAPWEIYRTRSNITSGRVIDLYTKSGSVGQYGSLLILIPDFQVSISILAAGPDANHLITTAAEMVLQAFVPVLEQVSRDQACRVFCGKYHGPANSSLALSVDDGPGLLVSDWISSGVDIKASGQAYSDATSGGQIRSIRLYPTGLRSQTGAASGSTARTLVSYRALFEVVDPDADPDVPRIFDPNAGQWSEVDNLVYGTVAVDDFLFHLDQHGNTVAVEPRVVRQVLRKASCPT